VATQSERRREASPRNEAALEEIRRLFARYRAPAQRPIQRAERHYTDTSLPGAGIGAKRRTVTGGR